MDLTAPLARAIRNLQELTPAERVRAALQWYEENKQAVDAYNQMIEERGLYF
jgi:post-segregation antitoxin (ccd killing protein)